MKLRTIRIINLFILITGFVLPAIAGDNICPIPPDPPELIYDPENPTGMDSGTTADIRVIGGVEPLNWSSSNSDYEFSYSTTFDRVNPLTSLSSTCGDVTVTITDSRLNPFNGTPYPQQVSGSLNNPLAFEWGPGDDLTIHTWETIEVSISGGNPPFDWAISGTDFYFVDYEENPEENQYTNILTDSRTLFIYADDYSCAADITITDNCGNSVRGSVRNIDSDGGRWALVEDLRDQENYPGDACGVSDAERPGLDYSNWWANGGYYFYSKPYLKGKYYIPYEHMGAFPRHVSGRCDTKSWDACNTCLLTWKTCQDMGWGGEWPVCTWKSGTFNMVVDERKKYEWICD